MGDQHEAAARPLDADEMRLWMAFVRASILALDALDRDLREGHGLSMEDYEILVYLSEAPQAAMTMTDLAQSVLVSPSRLTYRIDRLVKAGMVRREPCPTDARRVFAVLTDCGLERLQRAWPSHLAGVRRYVVDPAASSTQQTAEALEAMVTALTQGSPCNRAEGPA